MNSKEGSFEIYERILQGPLLINKQTGFVFVLIHGARKTGGGGLKGNLRETYFLNNLGHFCMFPRWT